MKCLAILSIAMYLQLFTNHCDMEMFKPPVLGAFCRWVQCQTLQCLGTWKLCLPTNQERLAKVNRICGAFRKVLTTLPSHSPIPLLDLLMVDFRVVPAPVPLLQSLLRTSQNQYLWFSRKNFEQTMISYDILVESDTAKHCVSLCKSVQAFSNGCTLFD